MTHDEAKAAIYRDAVRAVALGLTVNLALGVVKLGGGLIGGSFALVSDAANSLGDVFVSSAVLFALWLAQRPADEDHPYGHTRAEAIAGLSVALLVMVAALLVGWEALRRFGDPAAVPPVWTLWIAAANVVIKEALYWFTRGVGRRTGSTALEAGAWDHRSDALCSLAVFIGLGIAYFGGNAYAAADKLAALAVVGVIVWSGTRLFLRSAHELMDVQAEEELVRNVREAAEAVPEVKAVETLRLRKSGLEHFVDIHVEVDPELTVAQGHDIGHEVKDEILGRFPEVRDVLVHIEPHETAEGPVRLFAK